MALRVAVVGAGGQVGAEVTLMLSAMPDVEVVPVVRSRATSAFLRYHGVPVVHGDITNSAVAAQCLEHSDLVLNFALAGGTPAEVRDQNALIIRSIARHAGAGSTIVLFSTLAVSGSPDAHGRWLRTAYGDLKRRDEKLATKLARRRGQRCFVLRLGHVAGTWQGLSEVCRRELMSPPVVLPDPDRLSNVVHVGTIMKAIAAIGQGRAGSGGRFDLVNQPQWTWREVYAREAADLGVPLTLVTKPEARERQQSIPRQAVRAVLGAIDRDRAKTAVSRIAHRLSVSFAARLKSEYYRDRAAQEICALRQGKPLTNPAALWPALQTNPLPGLDGGAVSSGVELPPEGLGSRWPSDLPPIPQRPGDHLQEVEPAE